MSIERGVEYYDEIYSSSKEYKKDYKESVYFDLWRQVLKLIPENVDLIELGCGNGQFSNLLPSLNPKSYIGYDYSSIAIKDTPKIEGFEFICEDLNKFKLEEGKFYIALEIFEHIKDFLLIHNIGLGSEIVFTVPDFNDNSHVRYFHDVNAVVDRYKNVIQFEHISKFQKWFVCKGVTI